MKRFVVDGATAVVTGAAGGIGRAMARELSTRGANLVLLDRDEVGLASIAVELRASRADRASRRTPSTCPTAPRRWPRPRGSPPRTRTCTCS